MTTIRDAMEPRLLAAARNRLQRLRDVGAPSSVIEVQEAKIEAGDLARKIGHIGDYGDCEFVEAENREYRRGAGARFTLADGRQVDMIPGPYGLFLVEVDNVKVHGSV